MVWFGSTDGHKESCTAYRRQLASKFQALQSAYGTPLTKKETSILRLPLTELVDKRKNGNLHDAEILSAFGKQALAAQKKSNCLSDILLPLDPNAPQNETELLSPKPLLGVPISIKDVIHVAGTSTTLGFSSRADTVEPKDAPLVTLLKDAGAHIVCKSTVPTGLLSFETESDLFGWTAHPFAHLLDENGRLEPDEDDASTSADSPRDQLPRPKSKSVKPKVEFSPGASTGGGASLLAHSGALIEIGTDIGGSLRYPPAFTGLFGLRPTIGRFPSVAAEPCCPGLEGFESVGPLARSIDDLESCWRAVVEMKPWAYDHTCAPIPWRNVDFVQEGRKPRFAVLWNDGLISLTPACKRGLQIAVDALRKAGYEVVDFDGPSPLEALAVGYALAFSDGGTSVIAPKRPSERINAAISLLLLLFSLPYFVKSILSSFITYFSPRNATVAALLPHMHSLSVKEERTLRVKRDVIRQKWREWMKDRGVDFVLGPLHGLPAMPRGGTGVAGLLSAEYAFVWNVLDMPAGNVPVTSVSSTLDVLPSRSLSFASSESWTQFKQTPTYASLNDVERQVWSLYDPVAMAGLPVNVQIVGARFEEEKVLKGMAILEEACKRVGEGYQRPELF